MVEINSLGRPPIDAREAFSSTMGVNTGKTYLMGMFLSWSPDLTGGLNLSLHMSPRVITGSLLLWGNYD